MSTIHYPLDRRDPDISAKDICISDQVALLKRTYPEIYGRALDYLEYRFSLNEADILGQDHLLYLLFGSAESQRQADRLILTHTELTRKSVKNAFDILGWDSEEPHLTQVVEMVRRNIGDTFESMETFLEGFCSPARADGFMERKGIPLARRDALEEMEDRFRAVTAHWEENDCALDDEQLAEHFASPLLDQQQYLSTYFDSAHTGLVDSRLQPRIELVSRRGEFSAFANRMKRRLTRSLEVVRAGEKRRFLPQNAFFQANGRQAFIALRDACMSPGQRVLATSQEYFEIIKEMAAKDIKVTPFSSTDDLVRRLDDSRSEYDFILASEVSRYGTVHPLHLYDEARQLLSPSTKLIVDACQSAGRWKHDMGRCHADAVILSPQKGSDMGMGMGVVAVADDFKHRGLADLAGTLPPADIARTAFALNPDGLQTLSPSQRAQAISANAKKFLQLLSVVNNEVGNRIRVLNPKDFGSEMLGHAVELEIEGVSREEICTHAGSHGAYLNPEPTSPDCGESVRIAFHPYMNNDAIKILAYALLEVCGGATDTCDYTDDQF